MKNIKIVWKSDSYDCETCGYNYSEGADVFIDNEQILSFVPVAHCYNGKTYESDFIYQEIFKYLGYDVSTDYSDIF